MISDAILTGVSDGIVSNSVEIIGTILVTALLKSYYAKREVPESNSFVENEVLIDSDKERLLKMLNEVGFEEAANKVSVKSSLASLDWSSVRELKIVLDRKESFSTVGGLLNSVWESLDQEKRIVFLIKVLLNDIRLEVSPSKKVQIIASEAIVNDYLLTSGSKKSLWAFKKSIFGHNIYFLNNYGYKNAPDLINIVTSLFEDTAEIEITPVVYA